MSPVGDGYNKPGLAAAKHRLEMVKLGTAPTNSWMADSWEALQPGYVRTLHVLRSVREELNHALQVLGPGKGSHDGKAQAAILSWTDICFSMAQWVGQLKRTAGMKTKPVSGCLQPPDFPCCCRRRDGPAPRRR